MKLFHKVKMEVDSRDRHLHIITSSSATAAIVRDADDVGNKFSEVIVHLAKKRHQIPFKFTQYYTK